MSKLEGIIGGTCIALGTLGFALFGDKLDNQTNATEPAATITENTEDFYRVERPEYTLTITPIYTNGQPTKAQVTHKSHFGDFVAYIVPEFNPTREKTPEEQAAEVARTAEDLHNLDTYRFSLDIHDRARRRQPGNHFTARRSLNMMNELTRDSPGNEVDQQDIKDYEKRHSH